MVATNHPAEVAAARPWGRNFLARPLPLALIFGSFFVFTLPLVLMEHAGAFDGWRISPTFVFVAVLGMSHFLITFPVYLNKTNMEHFTGSAKSIIAYFVAPVAIIIIVGGFYYLRAWERSAGIIGIAGFWVFSVLRGLDFYHVLRQTFGVLELTKSQSKLTYPAHTKDVSRAFFMALFLMQYHTFVNDKAFTLDLVSGGLAAISTVLFTWLMVVYVARYLRSAPEDKSYALIPIAYLILQTAGAVMVVYRSMFYLASLAMHYIEYHILMQPRVFAHLQPNESVADRLMDWFKRNQWIFYLVLVGTSLFFYMGPRVFNDFEHPLGGKGWIFAVFVAQTIIATLHFYVDALLWRFGNPFYRKTLGPLYFKP
ncbi:MAG: hypothetical protein H6730_14870 [Deltaproteobacteria bacterium]|nr:hypothetical protein [Deltaproteobacteria bacterium]